MTLEWGFNITSGFKLLLFQLSRLNDKNRYNTVVIRHKDGSVSHLHDRIKLAESGTPAFIIITAEEADETEYCCIVNTDKSGSDGQKESCVELKILGKCLSFGFLHPKRQQYLCLLKYVDRKPTGKCSSVRKEKINMTAWSSVKGNNNSSRLALPYRIWNSMHSRM